MGTLVATEAMDEPIANEIASDPRMFEVSRNGVYDLNPSQHSAGFAVSKRWFREWLMSNYVPWRLLLSAVALFAIVFWITIGIVDKKSRGGGTWLERLKRVASNTVFWLICGVPLIVLGVGWLAQHGSAAREPMTFLSGISIWPSEMLRLVALLLAVHFMIKAQIDLRANADEIDKRFGLQPLRLRGSAWRNVRLGLRRWQSAYDQWLLPESKFTAGAAWRAYLLRNRFWPRFVRIAALFVFYVLFAFSAFFRRIDPPARGDAAFTYDRVILVCAVVALLMLTFYVVDAIQLNSNFIRIFTRGLTRWAPRVSQETGRIPPLTDAELSRYHDIVFVADRTQVVARLIWYPVVVLTLLFVARSSYFDNWTWPINLVLIFVLNAAWALGSAFFLRHAAERLRETAIEDLQRHRFASYRDTDKREMFDELIPEIRALKKGAFAPLSEQPFIRAILYPSGGIGLIAVAQRLLENF
jgi:hypothetical protein